MGCFPVQFAAIIAPLELDTGAIPALKFIYWIMKGILTWLAVVAFIIVTGLVFFGARPADLLKIPVALFNDIVLKKGDAVQGAPAESPSAVATPVAAAQPPSTVAPVAVVQTPPVAPAPAAVAISTPVAAMDIATLDNTPSEWPKIVTLKVPVDFPVVMNGQTVGNAVVPVGMRVNLVALKGEQAQVEYQGASKLIPFNSTDVLERVRSAHAGSTH